MSEVWQPKPKSVIQEWIDTCREELGDELSAWEDSFIDSVEEQLNRRGSLSERQEEILEKIYARTP